MSNPVKLKVVRSEAKPKRVLPTNEPMPLVPPVFEEQLIDFRVKGIKWLHSIIKFSSR